MFWVVVVYWLVGGACVGGNEVRVGFGDELVGHLSFLVGWSACDRRNPLDRVGLRFQGHEMAKSKIGKVGGSAELCIRITQGG